MLKGFTNVDAIISIENTSRTRTNGVKLRCKQVQLDGTNDVVREWNKLPLGVAVRHNKLI